MKTEMHRKCHVLKEAEVGVMGCAKDQQPPPEAKRGKERFYPVSQRELDSADSLISEF